MAIREGRWDCASCGSRAIYGRHVDCPGCGRPRPRGVRFYLTDDAPVVTDPERLAEARAGADWVCTHCDASNRAGRAACGGCGAPRDAEDPTQAVREHGPGDVPRAGVAPARTPAAGRPATAARHWRRWVLGGFVAAWAVAAVADEVDAGRLFERPTPLVPAVVQGVAWEVALVVEERRLVAGQGTERPDSAVQLDSVVELAGHRRELAGYDTTTRREPRVRQVVTGHRTEMQDVQEEVVTGYTTYTCGTRDLGNGYFEDRECSEPEYETRTVRRRVRVPITRADTTWVTVTERAPVYRQVPVHVTRYRYTVREWVPVDTLTASGSDSVPVWPAAPELPGRRIGQRLESYTATARDARGRVHTVSVDADELRRYRPGVRVAVPDTDWTSRLLPPDSLPACRRWHRGRGDPPPDSLGCSPRATRAERRPS